MIERAILKFASREVFYDLGMSIMPDPENETYVGGLVLTLAVVGANEQAFEILKILRPYGQTQESIDVDIAQSIEELENTAAEYEANASKLGPEVPVDQQQ